jgi:hypothetical protein
MPEDRYGKIITNGCRVFNTYTREYGFVTDIPNDGVFDFVKVKYPKREDYTSPIELEISFIQKV